LRVRGWSDGFGVWCKVWSVLYISRRVLLVFWFWDLVRLLILPFFF
jgi:hypothetical protein